MPGMEGFVAEGQAETVGQGEFFSRSAGYLSFVDGSWTKEDLAREMGLERDRDEPPVTPRDFPDLSRMPRQSEGGAELTLGGRRRRLDEDFKELIPAGLPRAFDAYHPMRMKNVDYLVAKTNDGRLDLREIMMARRRESDGRFVGEAQRVDTAAMSLNLAPAYYHEVPWTERVVIKEEKHSPRGGPAEYDTRVANTVRTYLVHARRPMDARYAHDRQLDFTQPVLTLDADGELPAVTVRGAEEASGTRATIGCWSSGTASACWRMRPRWRRGRRWRTRGRLTRRTRWRRRAASSSTRISSRRWRWTTSPTIPLRLTTFKKTRTRGG